MLKRVLLALVALFVAFPFIHRPTIRAAEPSDKQEHSPKKPSGKKQAHPQPTPALATPTAVPSPSPLREHPIEEGSPKSKHEEYNPGTDTLYRWYLRATIGGVAVGLVGLGFLIYQTVLGRRTAKAAKDSADAALKSATAVIDAERAWIVADVETPPPGYTDNVTRLVCLLRNVGKTPARIVEVAERVFVASEKYPLPERPEYLPESIHPSPLKGGALMAPSATMPRLVYVTPSDMKRVENGTLILHVYGYVVYRDVFSQQEHRTDYGFILNIPLGGRDPATRMFFMSDLPGYNEAT